MEHIKLYENFNQKTMIIKHRNFGEIKVELQGSQIIDVVNNSNVMFPFAVNSSWNMSVETWACRNNFVTIETWINNRMAKKEETCPEERVAGIRVKDIPHGHPLRMMYPSKFKK